MPSEFKWTPKREAKLAKLWAEGVPAKEIAAQFGPIHVITPAAMIGKARRLGLGAHPNSRKANTPQPEAEAGAEPGIVVGFDLRTLEPAVAEERTAPTPKFETREAWLLAFWKAAKPVFDERLHEVEGYNADATIRISVGWPSAGLRSKAIGECWHAEASKDQAREIFIRPSLLASTYDICHVLTHELVHAVLPDGEAHGKHFKRSAKALGLEGPAKATYGGDAWKEWANPLIDALGEFPGTALDGLPSGKKKQKSRQLKLACDNPECEFICRASAKQIEAHSVLVCPTECGGLLQRED